MSERTIDDLIRVLREGDNATQQQAAKALAALGEASVEPLIDVLRAFATYEAYAASDSSTNAVHAAEQALIDIGEPALLPLLRALREESWGAKFGAIYCLGEMGDLRAVQPLIEALDTDDVNVITGIADCLLKFGEAAVRPLTYALRQQGAAGRAGAAFTLGIFNNPLATPALIEALNDEDANVRASAANALGEISDARAVQPLIAAADDTDAAVREAAVRALGGIGLKLNAPHIAVTLEAAVDDADWGTRQSAAEMLIRLKASSAERARQMLLRDLQDADHEVQLGAAWSLLPDKAPQAVDALLKLLTAPDVRVSGSAALILGEYGDSRAAPALKALLRRSDEQVMHAAQTALRKLGHDTGA